MSQQNVKASHPANADGYIPPPLDTNSKPPTSTSSITEPKVEITSNQVLATDITDLFNAAASGILLTQYLLPLLTIRSFEYWAVGQR